MSAPDLVTVGRVVKPHGRRGEVVVQPHTDSPDRFRTLRRAWLAGAAVAPREVEVEGSFPHQGRFVLKISGVDSIDAAETLRGLDLRIAESELAPLPDGSYYHHQLAGMRVQDQAGTPLGVVEDVVETGAEARVLVVRGEAGETLLPFAADFVLSVDVAAHLLVARRPEYVVAD